jgi:hypothetical protein
MPRALNSFDQRLMEKTDNYSGLTSAQFSPNLAINNFIASGKVFPAQPSDIVSDRLVCYLDAAIGNSYPQSGNTWTDLSGNNNNGTLVNGPTYSSTNGGIFNFNGSNWVTIPLDLYTSNYTIFVIGRYTGSINKRVIGSSVNNWLLGWWNGQTNQYYAEGWVSNPLGTAETSWICYAGTGNYTSDSWELYRNGVSIAGPNNAGANGPQGGIRVGGGAWSEENSASQVGIVLVYNRVLSAAEILQNFNATRARFGI